MDARHRLARGALTAAAVLLIALCATTSFTSADTTAPPRPSGAAAGAVPSAKVTDRPLRILCIMNIDTMSHHIWMAPLTVELARRGHHVSSVDVAMPKEVPPTLNVSVIETAFKNVVGDKLRDWINMNVLQQLWFIYQLGVDECETDLAAPSMQKYIDKSFEGTFDLIIVDYIADCMLGFTHRFGYAPVIVLSPLPGSSWLHDLMGSPAVPAVVPMVLVPFPKPMSLWHRTLTTAIGVANRLIEWYHRHEFTRILKAVFGEDIPVVDELRKHVHLAFVNEDPVLGDSRGYPPSVIPVGGMHIRPANLSRIPADLRTWLDDAKDGFIFVSFGSIMKGANIHEDKKRALVQGFNALGKVRVLWKIEDGVVENLATNVKTSSWLPQGDILGHPNLLLFVSHCGGLSTQESSYNGVPLLGVPLIVDQYVNVEKAMRIGMARQMPYSEISKERFLSEVREMLNNPKYREAARQTSLLLRDQKETPLERAVWWAEYVGRHGGAPHLRSPLLDQPWPQAMLFDIIALAVLAVLAVIVLFVALVRLVLRCGGKKGRQPETNKRHKKD